MNRHFHLWLTAAWCGAAVMAFELSGARLLMPTFGMGIEVWATVIAVTLGALTVGYWLGGHLADSRPNSRSLALILLLAAVGLAAARVLGRTTATLLGGMSLVAGALSWAALVLVLPLLLFGMVQPLLARLMIASTERTGKVVGGLLAVATLGSVGGTLLTGLVLIPRVGVSRTLTGLAAGTALMAAVAFGVGRRWRAAAVAAALAVLLACGLWWPGHTPLQSSRVQVLDRVDGLYGELQVLQDAGSLSLVCNGIVQTTVPLSTVGIPRGTLIGARDYTELIPYFRPRARTALLIGLGAGLHERALAIHGIEVECVEIDPAVVRLATEHFGLWAEVTVADGRAFLHRDDRRHEAIILDAFFGATVPEHLYTKEAFELMAKRLGADGLLTIHLIGRPGHPAVRAVARTVEAVFPHQVAVRSGVGEELQQIYLFASHAPLELRRRWELDEYGFTGKELCQVETVGAQLLTDDRTCLSLLNRDVAKMMRRNSLQERREPSW